MPISEMMTDHVFLAGYSWGNTFCYRRPLAQPGEGRAYVRPRCRGRIPASALAADRRQTDVSELRLSGLLRLSPFGQSAALTLQGVPCRFLGDIGHLVRLAQAAAAELPDGHRTVLQ